MRLKLLLGNGLLPNGDLLTREHCLFCSGPLGRHSPTPRYAVTGCSGLSRLSVGGAVGGSIFHPAISSKRTRPDGALEKHPDPARNGYVSALAQTRSGSFDGCPLRAV